MDIRNLLRVLAPVVAVAFAGCLSACDKVSDGGPDHSSVNIDINGDKGKPLADLDLSGPPPHSVALLGPDKVMITPGDKLTITVDGNPASTAKLRFTLTGNTLGIMRQNHSWSSSTDSVTVHVTMPAPSDLVMSGSGSINAQEMAQKASVTIAGSGTVATPSVDADKLAVVITGSGAYSAGGKATSLELNIAGSGNADLGGLKVDKAEVNVAGSGSSKFASDGQVTANILGSGLVTVSGRAHCTVSALGTGKLVCEPGDGKGTTASTKDDGAKDN